MEMGQEESEPKPTFHLALAKFFSIWAQTPSLMFLSEAALPEILERRRVHLIRMVCAFVETAQPCVIKGHQAEL